MKKNNTLKLAFAFCFGFFSLLACKERSAIKPDIIPPVDNINTFALTIDSFNATLTSGFYDSIRTDNYTNPLAVIGYITDPFYGKTTAGLFMQVAPPLVGFNLPTDVTYDSIALVLPYDNFSYGDMTDSTNYKLKLNVFRITQNDFLVMNSVDTNKYYSFDHLSIAPSPLASATVSINNLLKDSVIYPNDGDTLRNILRIKFPDNSLINEFLTYDSATLNSDSAFTSIFNGLYIVPDTTDVINYQNRLDYFYLGDAGASVPNIRKAHLEIFYHKQDGTKGYAIMPYKAGSTAFFSHISHNYQSYPAASFYNQPTHDSVTIQSFPGLYTTLTLNHLQNIPKSIINKAQLTITMLKVGNDDKFTPPATLIPRGVNDDGSTYTITDMLDNSGSATNMTVGGSSTIVTINGQQYIQYQINIPRELQKAIIAGKDSLKIRLAAVLNYPASYRLVADGINGAPDTKLKFDVVYTLKN